MFFVLLLSQALLAHQHNTQAYAIIIKFTSLCYFASFQLSKHNP